MIEKNKVYKFKEEFCKELKIPANQYNRKQKELLDWLVNFFDFEFYDGRPLRIYIKEIYGKYMPLPRKIPNQTELTQQKQDDIKNYVLTNILSPEPQYTSKAKVAREYISDEGEEKYGLTNFKYVAQTYVKPVFDVYAENDGQSVWVWYKTYMPINQIAYDRWNEIKKEEKIDEQKAAGAFYKMAQGKDISKELTYYQKAIKRMQKEFNDFPIYVDSWRLKYEYWPEKFKKSNYDF